MINTPVLRQKYKLHEIAGVYTCAGMNEIDTARFKHDQACALQTQLGPGALGAEAFLATYTPKIIVGWELLRKGVSRVVGLPPFHYEELFLLDIYGSMISMDAGRNRVNNTSKIYNTP